jgi:hypothetical protein
MPQEKHPFDVAAERLESLADAPVAAHDTSPDYWELRGATDETVGDYPQADLANPGQVFEWGESEGLGPDGFPAVPVPEQRLKPMARWTDVLKLSLPASWSEGHVFNEKALAVFKQCDLGVYREYPAIVRDETDIAHTLTYLHIRNMVEPVAIDFERSEFYIADMLGIPKSPIAIDSFDDWREKMQRAEEGTLNGCEEFSTLEYKRLYFRHGQHPVVDYFRIARLGTTVYVSARLKDAILSSGITGLEIKPNKRLFAD